VLVHPSLTEAFGVAAVEAQAMGLPVVCSDAGGLAENVAHGVSGFVVPRRDAAAITERLAELAGDPALRRSMSRAARLRAETVLSAERQLDAFEELYRDLLADPAPAAAPSAEPARDAARQTRAEELRLELAQLKAREEALRLQLWRRQVVEEVHAFAQATLPAGARVLVVSRGDEEIVALPGRHGSHFPQTEDGAYAGHHPADSKEAIAHLEALRGRGADYLVVPATSDWWLEHYADLAAHLDAEHERIAEQPERYVAFALRAPAGAPAKKRAKKAAAVAA